MNRGSSVKPQVINMSWFNNLNARPKLMISFGLLLAITTFIGYEGVVLAIALNGKIDTLYSRDVIGLAAVKDVEIDKALIARCSRNAILGMAKKEDLAIQEKEFSKLFAKLHADLTTAETLETSTDVRDVLRSIRGMLPAYEKSARQVFERVQAQDAEGAKAALKAASSGIIKQLNSAVSLAGVDKQKNVAEAKQQAAAQFSQSLHAMLATLLAAIALGMLFAFFLARAFSRPLIATVQLLRHVAAGDLTHKLEIETRDEIGSMANALNEAIDSIRHTLSSVGAASKTLTSVSNELAKSALSLAGGTQEQAASLEETSASLEQISVAVRHSSDNANQASRLAASSRDAAENGGRILAAAVGAMNEISAASKEISAIIGAIDEITFQTNLLAVNASIEAAHAGDQGRGFAVVATEVRTLAQRSARAAQEIKNLVENSVHKINNGAGLVNTSGQNFEEIISAVKNVTSIVGEIAVDAREQTVGIEQVALAMNRIDQVNQGNSTQTERLSETAWKVAEHAQQLETLVNQFVVEQVHKA